MSKIILENVSDFNTVDIFECGQCFRWNKEDNGSYTGVAFGKILNIDNQGKNVILENTTVEEFNSIWRDYFDFDTDYDIIKKELTYQNPEMEKAIKYGEGIRILNQELWETIVSFIISANNNIPRIKGCIEKFCETFGEEIGYYEGKKYYAFPTVDVVCKLSLDDLATCKMGYRAKYVIETAKQFVKEEEEYITHLLDEDTSSEDAYNYISTLAGVGPKVANCILLFSMKKRDRFPIDVWVKKVMSELYGIDENDVNEMEFYAQDNFGKYSGIAQQYLFNYMRNKKHEPEGLAPVETKIINKDTFSQKVEGDKKEMPKLKNFDDKEDYRETFRREDSRRMAREALKKKARKERHRLK